MSRLVIIIALFRFFWAFFNQIEVVQLGGEKQRLSYRGFCLKQANNDRRFINTAQVSARKVHSPFGLQTCRSSIALAPPQIDVQWYAVFNFRTWIEQRIFNMNHRIQNICRALLLGGVAYDDSYRNFKQLGLLHLFSVSGLHINFVFALLMVLYNGVFQSLRMLIYRPVFWRQCSRSYRRELWVMPLLLVYVVACGARPPAVRAWLICFFGQWSGNRGPLFVIKWAFVVQILLYPASIWQISFGISWMVYLIIKCFLNQSSGQGWRDYFSTQILIFLGAAVWLPNQPFWTIVFNLMFLPFAGYIFYGAVAHLLFLDPISQIWLLCVGKLTGYFAEFGRNFNLLVNMSQILPIELANISIKALFFVILLNCCDKLAKRVTVGAHQE